MTDLPWSLRCASRLVGAVYDLAPEVFMAPAKGPPEHVHARQIVAYLLSMEGGFDQKEVAVAMGRHHSTVWHAVQKIEALRDEDEMDRAVTRIADMYRSLKDARICVLPAMHLDPAA